MLYMFYFILFDADLLVVQLLQFYANFFGFSQVEFPDLTTVTTSCGTGRLDPVLCDVFLIE
jgi:hypothetical protein